MTDMSETERCVRKEAIAKWDETLFMLSDAMTVPVMRSGLAKG